MPLSRYFDKPGNGQAGKGAAVMAAMKKRYGEEAGERVFYATVNRDRKGTPAERAAQPTAAPGSALGRAVQTAEARRKRRPRKGQLSGPIGGTGARVEGPSLSTTRVGY